MAAIEPVHTENLDIYGAPQMPWAKARELLEREQGKAETPQFLSTVRPDGRPHTAGIGAIWDDGTVYFVSGPGTRKSRNLAANPACTLAARLPGLDIVLEGRAERITDEPTLERVAALYRESGWPAEVEGRAFTAPFSAQSAGPPPWHLYRMSFDKAIALELTEPHGAASWRFRR